MSGPEKRRAERSRFRCADADDEGVPTAGALAPRTHGPGADSGVALGGRWRTGTRTRGQSGWRALHLEFNQLKRVAEAATGAEPGDANDDAGIRGADRAAEQRRDESASSSWQGDAASCVSTCRERQRPNSPVNGGVSESNAEAGSRRRSIDGMQERLAYRRTSGRRFRCRWFTDDMDGGYCG